MQEQQVHILKHNVSRQKCLVKVLIWQLGEFNKDTFSLVGLFADVMFTIFHLMIHVCVACYKVIMATYRCNGVYISAG